MQYRVLDRVEHDLDVLGVDGSGEVMKKRLPGVLLHRHEHVQNKVLHVLHGLGVADEMWEVPANVGIRRPDFFVQEIGLVQEENYRDSVENAVVHDGVKNVPRFFQSVGFPAIQRQFLLINTANFHFATTLPILQQHLIEFRGRHEEEYRSDAVEALEPFLPLGALTSDVDKQKRDVIYRYDKLGNSLGRFPAVQNVLMRRHIILDNRKSINRVIAELAR